MEIKKAYSEDFDKIYPLLLLFNNPSITVDDWKKLFVKYWDSNRDYFGYYIEENGEAVGFFGLIFSDRVIGNSHHTFCNMTSWIVKPEHRKYGLKLLNQVLSEKDIVFTNFTANPTLFDLFLRLRFQVVDEYFMFTFPFYLLNLKMNGIKISDDINTITSKLNDDELKLIEDHRNTKVNSFLLFNKNEYCLIIASKQHKKRLPVSQVLYVGNNHLFSENLHYVTGKICLKQRTVALLTGGHFLVGKKPVLAMNFERKTFFKGDAVTSSNIDFLYSELSK